MTEQQEIFAMMAAIIFSLTSMILFIRLQRIKKKSKLVQSAPAIPVEVQHASHDLANQALKLRSGLRRIAQAENPLEALVNAIARNGNGNGNGTKPDQGSY